MRSTTERAYTPFTWTPTEALLQLVSRRPPGCERSHIAVLVLLKTS
jgi:hypothetical protein